MPDVRKLVSVLKEVRELLALPDNDFSWSYWRDTEHALAEIDRLLSELSSGVPPGDLNLGILFAPTGPIQEVALSSGWGDEFIEIADRFDEAMAGDEMGGAAVSFVHGETCKCLTMPAGSLVGENSLGMDSRLAEVSTFHCPGCCRQWLKYLYEVEGFTGSGRWYLGPISAEQLSALTAETAKAILESLEWYYCGGSYFGGQVTRASGRIMLNP